MYLDTGVAPVTQDVIGTVISGSNLDRIISNTDPHFYGGMGVDASKIIWKENQVYVSSSGNDTTGLGTKNSPVATLTKAQELLNDGGTINVMNNIDMTKTLTVIKDMTITSSDPTKPVTLKRGAGLGKAEMITGTSNSITLQDIILDGGAIFSDDSKDPKYDTTLKRSTTNTGLKSNKTIILSGGTLNLIKGTIIQNADTDNISGGAAVHVYKSANLHMDKSVIIRDCQQTASWGGAICDDNMTGTIDIAGEIYGCSATSNGGAIAVRAGAGTPICTIVNVNIHNNTSNGNGSSVYLENIPQAIIKDSSITNNKVSKKGNGAVYTTADITISGKVIIKENIEATSATSDNLVLANGKLIKTDGLAVDSEIYVDNNKAPVVGDKIGIVISGGNLDKIISNSNNDYRGILFGTSDIMWIGKLDTVYVSSNGNDNAGFGTNQAPVATLVTAQEILKDSGGTICIMDSIDVSGELDISKNMIIKSLDVSKPVLLKRTDDSTMIRVLSTKKVTLENAVIDGGAVYATDGNETDYNTSLLRSTTNTGIVATRPLIYVVGRGTILNVINTTIQNVESRSNGQAAAINCNGTTVLNVDENSVFKNCSQITSDGGAIVIHDNATGVIQGEFVGCFAKGSGAVLSATGLVNDLITLKNINIHNNVSFGTGNIYCLADMIVERKVLIFDNFNEKKESNNVVLTSGKLLKIKDLTADSKIYLDTGKNPVLGDVIGTTLSGGNFDKIINNGNIDYYGKQESGSSNIVWYTTLLSDVYVSNTGDDGTGNGTILLPLASLNRAQQMLVNGGTIHVVSDLNIDTTFVASKNLTISSIDTTKPVMIKRIKDIEAIRTSAGITVILDHIIIDGGAVYATDTNATGYNNSLQRSTVNSGMIVTNPLISEEGNNTILKLVGTTVENAELNTVNTLAAGIASSDSSVLEIDENSILKNCTQITSDGGAILLGKDATGRIQGQFIRCYTTGKGAVLISNNTAPDSLLFKNCNVHNNVSCGVGNICSCGDIAVEGKVLIDDNFNATNKTNNLVLDTGKIFKIKDLTADSQIYLDINKSPIVNDVLGVIVSGKEIGTIINNTNPVFFGKKDSTTSTIVWDAKAYVSNSGNDTTGLGIQASPVSTLTRAQELLSDGGTICVMNNIDMIKTLTVTKDMMITSSDPTKPVTIKRGAGLGKSEIINGTSNTITLQDIILDGGAIFSSDSKDAKYDATLKRSTTNTGLKSGKTIILSGGTLNLNKGVIIQNADTDNISGGAAVHVYSSASLRMDKSVIIRNCQQIASWSGAICDDNTLGTLNIAGEMYGCSATSNGGAIAVRAGTGTPTCTIANVNIHNNTSNGNGSTIYLENFAQASIKDSSIINNKVTKKGNGAIYTNTDITVSGKVVIKDNTEAASETSDNLVLVSGKLIKADGLTADSEIYVDNSKVPVVGDKIGTIVSGGNLDRIINNKDTIYCGGIGITATDIVWKVTLLNKVYVSTSGSDITGIGIQSSPIASLVKAQDILVDGGSIYVMDNLDVDSTLTIIKNMTITSMDPIKPVTIKRKGDFIALDTLSNVTINISNITIDGGAKHSNDPMDTNYDAKLKRSTVNTGLVETHPVISFRNSKGALNIIKTTIQNAENEKYLLGAGIQCNAGTLNIDENSSIKNCSQSKYSGGAIFIGGSSTCNIQGEYTGCYAMKEGAVIYVMSTGNKISLKNIDIHNNVSDEIGAVYANEDVTVEGKVLIHDNFYGNGKPNNLVLSFNKIIKAKDLTADSIIYLDTGKAPVVDDKIGTVLSGTNVDRIMNNEDTYCGHSLVNNDIVWQIKTSPTPPINVTIPTEVGIVIDASSNAPKVVLGKTIEKGTVKEDPLKESLLFINNGVDVKITGANVENKTTSLWTLKDTPKIDHEISFKINGSRYIYDITKGIKGNILDKEIDLYGNQETVVPLEVNVGGFGTNYKEEESAQTFHII